MRALVIDDAIAVRDLPEPEISKECRISVRLAGICGTDLEILCGYAGFRGYLDTNSSASSKRRPLAIVTRSGSESWERSTPAAARVNGAAPARRHTARGARS